MGKIVWPAAFAVVFILAGVVTIWSSLLPLRATKPYVAERCIKNGVTDVQIAVPTFLEHLQICLTLLELSEGTETAMVRWEVQTTNTHPDQPLEAALPPEWSRFVPDQFKSVGYEYRLALRAIEGPGGTVLFQTSKFQPGQLVGSVTASLPAVGNPADFPLDTYRLSPVRFGYRLALTVRDVSSTRMVYQIDPLPVISPQHWYANPLMRGLSRYDDGFDPYRQGYVSLHPILWEYLTANGATSEEVYSGLIHPIPWSEDPLSAGDRRLAEFLSSLHTFEGAPAGFFRSSNEDGYLRDDDAYRSKVEHLFGIYYRFDAAPQALAPVTLDKAGITIRRTTTYKLVTLFFLASIFLVGIATWWFDTDPLVLAASTLIGIPGARGLILPRNTSYVWADSIFALMYVVMLAKVFLRLHNVHQGARVVTLAEGGQHMVEAAAGPEDPQPTVTRRTPKKPQKRRRSRGR